MSWHHHCKRLDISINSKWVSIWPVFQCGSLFGFEGVGAHLGVTIGSLIMLKKSTATSPPSRLPPPPQNPLLPQEKQSLWPTKDLGLPAWFTLSPGAHTRFLIRGSQSPFVYNESCWKSGSSFFFFSPSHVRVGQELEADTPPFKCSHP